MKMTTTDTSCSPEQLLFLKKHKRHLLFVHCSRILFLILWLLLWEISATTGYINALSSAVPQE